MHGQYGRLAGEVQLVEVCLNGVASGPGGPAPWRAQGLFPEAVPHLGSALHSLGTLFRSLLVGFVKEYNHFLAVDQDSIESRKLSSFDH